MQPRCWYPAFTRIEPAPSPFDEIQEDITLEVKGQSLVEKVTWLPAMERFGDVACNTLDPEEVLDELLEAAEAVGHQATYGEDGTKRTILNGLADGENFPLLWFDPMCLLDDLADESDLDATTMEDIDRMLYGDDQPKPRLTFLSPSECENLALPKRPMYS
jgi:hypothetical protein